MADIETLSVDDGKKPTSAVARWTVSVAMLIALTAVTAATLHWYQPLRALFDEYLVDDIAQDSISEFDAVPQPHQEVQVPTDFLHIEEQTVLESTDQDSVDVLELLVEKQGEDPFTISARDVFSDREPIDSLRTDLQFAIVSITRDLDFTLANDALQRARSIALTNRLNQSLVEAIEKALADVRQLKRLNLRSIQDRLDSVSKLVVSIGATRSEALSVSVPDTSLHVSEEPDSQSFWSELSAAITDVYRVRRIDESTPEAEVFRMESGAQLRLLVMLERARSDLHVYDFESYRTSLTEAIAIVDALSHENSERFSSIRDELSELVRLELVSPHTSIRNALEELTNEAATPSVESAGIEP